MKVQKGIQKAVSLAQRSECKTMAAVAAGSCTLSILLTQHCLDMWGLFYNLGFNRCGFYVAGSPEFRCCCPHRWGRKAGHKTCLWNFGRINADMTASEQRSERLTFSTHTCLPSDILPDESRSWNLMKKQKRCACSRFTFIWLIN